MQTCSFDDFVEDGLKRVDVRAKKKSNVGRDEGKKPTSDERVEVYAIEQVGQDEKGENRLVHTFATDEQAAR